jgi:hypothetical protein
VEELTREGWIITCEGKGRMVFNNKEGDGFLLLFFSSIFKYQCGKRMKMGCRAWMVAG